MSLYSLAETTKKELSKFRFSSARGTEPQALVLSISKSQEISVDNKDDYPNGIIADTDELKDSLPASSPRFIILSYPHKLADGRFSSPYVMLYFRPATANQNSLMSYAGAVELVRNQAGVARVIEFQEEDDLDDLKELLGEN